MRFTKMHGIGNDYIYIDAVRELVEDPEALAVRMSDRHTGIGGDGIVLIGHSDTADFSMRMYNADGSDGGMCGNACRCVGKYVYERGLTDKTDVTLQVGSRVVVLHLNVQDGHVQSVKVDMGTPDLTPANIPVKLPGEIIMGYPLEIGAQRRKIHCVSMGNPHCVIFCNDPEDVDLETWGPLLENASIFPKRTNVEFVSVRDRNHIKQRTWERGSGETLACGSGACAVLVASVLTGQVDRDCEIQLRGGKLHVTWSADNNHLYQEGPAEFVFDGDYPV